MCTVTVSVSFLPVIVTTSGHFHPVVLFVYRRGTVPVIGSRCFVGVGRLDKLANVRRRVVPADVCQ